MVNGRRGHNKMIGVNGMPKPRDMPKIPLNTHIVGDDEIVLAKDLCPYLGVAYRRFVGLVAKGVIPPADGYIAPKYGESGPRGRFWLIQTIRRWEDVNEYDFKRNIRVIIDKAVPSMPNVQLPDNLHSAENTLGGYIANLMATELGFSNTDEGLTNPATDETLDEQAGDSDTDTKG